MKQLPNIFYQRVINPDTKAVTYWTKANIEEPMFITSKDLLMFEEEMNFLRCNGRICFHAEPESPLHDMIILEWAEHHYGLHRHPNIAETITALTNSVIVTINHRPGPRISTSTYNINPGATIKIPARVWHEVKTTKPYSIYRETKLGPFTPAERRTKP